MPTVDSARFQLLFLNVVLAKSPGPESKVTESGAGNMMNLRHRKKPGKMSVDPLQLPGSPWAETLALLDLGI